MPVVPRMEVSSSLLNSFGMVNPTIGSLHQPSHTPRLCALQVGGTKRVSVLDSRGDSLVGSLSIFDQAIPGME